MWRARVHYVPIDTRHRKATDISEGKMYRDSQLWSRVRFRILVEGVSRRQLSRQTGISRNTIKKMLLYPFPRRSSHFPSGGEEGIFDLNTTRHFYSGLPLQNLSGVDTLSFSSVTRPFFPLSPPPAPAAKAGTVEVNANAAATQATKRVRWNADALLRVMSCMVASRRGLVYRIEPHSSGN
jgi:hypothetical protein